MTVISPKGGNRDLDPCKDDNGDEEDDGGLHEGGVRVPERGAQDLGYGAKAKRRGRR